MNPTAFTIFGIDIKWYAIIITSAMMLGIYLTMKTSEKQGFVADHLLDLALVAIPCAIICARAYYVIFNFSTYDSFIDMINIRLGGMAIHGGLIGGFIGGYIVAKRKNMNVLKVMDIISPYLILAQGIGRWGNFINQEAHGGPTNMPWGIMVDGVRVHPTFLYESIWDVAVFIVLLKLSKNKKFDGVITALYMILYSIGRFFIEGLRTDSLMIGPLRTAQLVSIAMACLGIFIIYKNKDRGILPAYNEEI